jgi:hypothetical protein
VGPKFSFGPTYPGTAEQLFVALLLIEPVLRTGQILRPIVQVQLASPGAVSLILFDWRLPWEISAGFPRPLVLFAHESSAAARRRTMRHHTPKRRAGAPGFPSSELYWQVAGR